MINKLNMRSLSRKSKYINNNYYYSALLFNKSYHQVNKLNKNNKTYNKSNLLFPIVGVSVGSMVTSAVLFKSYYQDSLQKKYENNDHIVMNFSGTHTSQPQHYFQPSSTKEVENLVSHCHKHGIQFRPMGTGLSPNGIAFSNIGIMDMSLCNKVLNINEDTMEVTVEAGIKIQDIISAIRAYNMSLENIPSITEQQIGGLIQVSAHGTGIDIGPCDMQVTSMSIVTPNHGKITLTPDDELFYYARVGLGCIGVVTEITLKCVKREKLSEHVFVMDLNDLIKNRNELISSYKHTKFLWIPYVNNKVICIAADTFNDDLHYESLYNSLPNDINDEIKRQKPLRDLYLNKFKLNPIELNNNLSFADLRDMLLGYNDAKCILDTNWIREINNAELKYWINLSNKYSDIDTIPQPIPSCIDFSENVLGFTCGGQQWVYEVCFPVDRCNINEIPIEIEFISELLHKIDDNNIAAPSPIEHRYTLSSSSYLSPAYSSNKNDIFCWIGIIFYLPTQNEQRKRWISNEFNIYTNLLNDIVDKYNGIGHWAKIETHFLNKNSKLKLQNSIKNKYKDNLTNFLQLRKKYDPKNILVNDVISELFDI